MRPLTLFVVMLALLAATAAASASNSTQDDELRQQLEQRLAEVSQTADEPILETSDDDDVPATNLLSDVGGLFDSVGATLKQGLGHVGAATTAALSAGTSALATALSATQDGVLWSIVSVYGLMTGTLQGALAGVLALATGTWGLLGSLAGSLAYSRPAGMSEVAWAGTVAAGATTASVAAHYGLWNLVRRYGWLVAGLPLFSRIDKDDLLDHPLRSEIFEAIKASPGIHISALARTVDAGWGTTIHHLRKLKEEDMVAVRMVNNQKCYFINGGGVGRDTWGAISHLKNATARRIAEFVHANPLIAVTELSHKLGISASLVSHHVAKLTQAGVLEKVRDGRFIRLALTQKAATSMFADETAVTRTAQAPIAA